MKKSKLLISLLFLICSLISIQISAQNKVVILDSVQSKKVIKALEEGKLHHEQLGLCLEVVTAKNSIIENQKNIIDTQLEQKNNYALAVEEKQKTITLQTSILDNKEKVIKKEKTKTSFWKVISGLLAGLVGYLVIVK